MRMELALISLLAFTFWVCAGPSCSSKDRKNYYQNKSVSIFEEEKPATSKAASAEVLPERPASDFDLVEQVRPILTAFAKMTAEVPSTSKRHNSEGLYQVKKGDTIYAVAKSLGIPWQKLYHLNKERLEQECLIQFGKPSLCRNGQWQYRLEIGGYLDYSTEISAPRLLAKSPQEFKPAKVKKIRVRAQDSDRVSAKSAVQVSLKAAKPADQILLASVSEVTMLSGQVKNDTGMTATRASVLLNTKIEDKVAYPVVAEIPEMKRIVLAGGPQHEPLPSAALSIPATAETDDATIQERCTQNAASALASLRAKGATLHEGTYFVCLKSGAVSSPLFMSEVRWLQEHRPDMLVLVGEHPTDRVCPVRQDCSRPHAWLRL